jgi:hypothetical protein
MPAKSKAQFRLMKAVEHDPNLAKKLGIKQETAKEFTRYNVGKQRFSKLKEKLGKK